MRQTALFIITFLLTSFTFGQAQDAWVRFYDTTTELSGYKDLKGNTKLPPMFGGFTRADTFYHIIAVTEKIDSSYKQYYILKDGRKVGQDSVFVFDFTFDCESEGKIIFKDWKKDRVGFLDKNGIAIIPAIYNYVSPFRNGIAIAHQNAKRKCWENGGDTTNCEHLGWEGGETILINDKNEILADSLNVDLSNINWYSKKTNDTFVDTSISINIKGRNNKTYSFLDYDKEFKKWFNNIFLPTLSSKSNLNNLLFAEITYWSEKEGWISIDKEGFLKMHSDVLATTRYQPNMLKEISISQQQFNELIFDKDIYKKYLNSCGEHNREKFPLFNVLLTYYKKRQKPDVSMHSELYKNYEVEYQENFEFLRTETGYKLLSAPIKK